MPPKKQKKSVQRKRPCYKKKTAKGRVSKKTKRGKASRGVRNNYRRKNNKSIRCKELCSLFRKTQKSRSSTSGVSSNYSKSNSIMDFIGSHLHFNNNEETQGLRQSFDNSPAPKLGAISALEGLKFVRQGFGATTEISFKPTLVMQVRKISAGSLTQDDKEDVMIVNPSNNVQGFSRLDDTNSLTETLLHSLSQITMVDSRQNRSIYNDRQRSGGDSEMRSSRLHVSPSCQNQNYLAHTEYSRLDDTNSLTETLLNSLSQITMVDSRQNRNLCNDRQRSGGDSEMRSAGLHVSPTCQNQNYLAHIECSTEPSTSTENGSDNILWTPPIPPLLINNNRSCTRYPVTTSYSTVDPRSGSLRHPVTIVRPSASHSTSYTRPGSQWPPATLYSEASDSTESPSNNQQASQ